ncbi:aminotransferase [Billgrantia kenyensis]|uniref:Aminotransferase class III-fold pyridoxal phosphate-dependent enzyme n=1 Tax=Billgrantia kenyensis TaxID=321266 RepID=A0A7V9W2Z8_9GAMM|nr:aminotransferase [Halomonas kenyensis]MBA2780090.1 aminotransferase class III-fold pyridoxal phosphate-dependent enzyme [Halomonas kenyensis]MCG6661963.1 aminotransferase class III-fold pyridoxal phosphate-dependent enzyme [Halomonas kenyensis]
MNMPFAASEALRQQDLDHHLHPFTDHRQLAAEGGPRIITHGEGVWLWDTQGRKLLDGMAGLWCVNVGYGRHELGRVAQRQINRLPYYNTFFQTSHEPVIELSAKLTGLLPEGLEHVFFANSGSEANDTALRLVRHYWQALGQPERRVIVSRRHAYHGSTIAAASLGGMSSMHDIPGVPIPDVVHVGAPYAWESGKAMEQEHFAEVAARWVEEAILAAGPERVAAFIGEPVMGAGGVIVPPAGYWQRVQDICRRYDILLICDEVVCGFGRTGNWFGAQTFDIRPDIVTMAKGLSSGYQPISAVAVGERVVAPLLERPGRFPHGFTYSGHPVAAAVALENLNIIEREGLVEHVHDTVGPALATGLGRLADHALVGEVRTLGAMAAVELNPENMPGTRDLPSGTLATRVRNLCFEHGLVTRAVRDGLVFAPPLVITTDEIATLVDILSSCLDEVAAQVAEPAHA